MSAAASLAPSATSAPRLKLYELPEAFRQIDATIEELDGELPPDIEAKLDLEIKSDAVCVVVKEAEAERDYYAAELERLTVRKRVAENRAQRLKSYLYCTLIALGRPFVQGSRYKARIQNNGGNPVIEWPGRVDELPIEFQKVVVSLDHEKVLAAHKAGTLPEGFSVSRGTHLRIS
jgi:hypothetical protein